MELSFTSRNILEAAFRQAEDAQYDNHAQIIIGNEMILVDEEEFEELRNDILKNHPMTDEIANRQFSDIVPTD